jgi:hypothetical protein
MRPLSDLEILAFKLDLKAKDMEEETFTKEQMINAVRSFLEYGEETMCAFDQSKAKGHQGYFSGSGFAARAMRYVYKQLKTEC